MLQLYNANKGQLGFGYGFIFLVSERTMLGLIFKLPASEVAATIVLFDVQVFNVFAESNRSSSPAATF